MKKKKTKSKAQHRNMTPDLPQNIIPVGERVFEDKNIYIHQKVYEQIHKFSANKTENRKSTEKTICKSLSQDRSRWKISTNGCMRIISPAR